MNMINFRFRYLFFFAFTLFGCKDAAETSTYQVAKENRQIVAFAPPPSNPASTPARMLALLVPYADQAWFIKAMGPEAEIGKITDAFEKFAGSLKFDTSSERPHWTLPKNWMEVANTSTMRVATLKADGDVEITISQFPFRGELDPYILSNVNRWRGQLQLPPTDQKQIKDTVKELDVSGGKGYLFDLVGLSATIPAGRIANPHGNANPGASGATAESERNSKANGAPDGWQPGRTSSMRFASYEVHRDSRKVEITVIPLGVAAGGLTENVNRWRDQIGLTPASDESIRSEVKSMVVDGTESQFIAIDNKDNSTSIYVVIVPRADKTWFIKMHGDAALAKEERQRFEEFSKNIDLP